MAQSVKSAERALEILELLTREPNGLTFGDICAELDLPKSSAHALLTTMLGRSFLGFDEAERRYTLGVRVWEAGQGYLAAADLQRISRPYMEAVRDQVNEIVQLAVLDGTDSLYVGKVEADQTLVLVSHVGSRLPAYATGVGKVLLADLDDDRIRARFREVEFQRFTPRTLQGLDRLLTELAAVRRRGYATDNGEYTPGVFCVAVPVRDHTGTVRAAMSVSIPDVRASAEVRRRVHTVLDGQAARLSERLGHHGRAAGTAP
ncbi:IclR family transcriptional regulator [Allosalinactinospora lopnorensis]|uniref:IclR family transcriptional regulator n=1 Tax=Allosalinactinospora lopnorensis TaxID=1352348 RepID=UPI000623D736|nr:IclR family transcriptional regulator [Allosalinactinospora lopnorensis]